MRGFVWLEKEVKLDEAAAAAAAGGKIFCIIMGQQGVSSTIQSLTRHHPLPIHECLGCLKCTQISRIPETFRLALPKKALVGDDDTIMFITHNLVQVLFKYNHTQPFYVGYAGYASEIHCQNIIFSYEMAFGGAGYAISHPFAKELAKIQDSCIPRCCNTFPRSFSLVQGYLSCLV
jgi:hypothetical protein